MKKLLYPLILIPLLFLWIACSDENDQIQEKTIDFGFTLMRTNYKVQQGELFSFNCKGISLMDRIELYINGENHQSWNQPESDFFQVKTDGLELGIYSIEIRGFKNNELISADGRVLMINSSESLKEIEFELVSSHPHNPTNFTQGYEFHNERLYESTGNPSNQGTTKVAEMSNCPVIISGGVSSIDDIKKAKNLNNVEGIIVGKAIYDGDIDLKNLALELEY